MPNVHVVQIDNEQNRKQAEQEKSKVPGTVQEFWESLTPKVQEEIIESQEVNVQIEIDLEELGIDAYEFADYVFLTIAPQREQAEQTKLEQEVIEVQELTQEVNEITEVTAATEILTQTPTTEIMQTEKVVNETVATATTVNNTQNVVNQQVTNIIVEQQKPIFKMSIADKIAEANKMLAIAHKKEQTENLLKDFYGYLNAKKDGDNFTLQSADKLYKFTTPNQELVDEVNNVLEKFLKNKISSFEMQLQNFQLV
jgi:hypothetical protein